MESIFVYLNFLIFLAVLIYFSRKPLANMAKAKQQVFLDQYREAQQSEERMQALLSELEDRKSSFAEELENMRSNILEVANREARQIREQSEQVAQAIIDDARAKTASDIATAQKNLEKEVLDRVYSGVVDRFNANDDVGPESDVMIIKRVEKIKSLPGVLSV